MTGQRVLLLHGVEHHRPTEHWLWSLAEDLRSRAVPVQYPQLPAPDAPTLREWLEIAKVELGMLGDGERVVVTHSLGCWLWRHLAPTLAPHELPTRVLLVAPPTADILWEPIIHFAQGNPPAPGRFAPTLIVGRDSDPYRTQSLAELASEWGGDHATIGGEGHLTPADGFGAWPGVREWVLDAAADVTAT